MFNRYQLVLVLTNRPAGLLLDRSPKRFYRPVCGYESTDGGYRPTSLVVCRTTTQLEIFRAGIIAQLSRAGQQCFRGTRAVCQHAVF